MNDIVSKTIAFLMGTLSFIGMFFTAKNILTYIKAEKEDGAV